MSHSDPTMTILSDQSAALIRSELEARNQRLKLERSVRDAINKLGREVDEVSDASGLTPDEINRIANTYTIEDELDALIGVG